MSKYDEIDIYVPNSTRKAFKKFVKRAGLIKPANWYLEKAAEFSVKSPLGNRAICYFQSYNDFDGSIWFERETYVGPSTPLYYAAKEVMRLDILDEGYASDFADLEHVYEYECSKMFDTCLVDWKKVDPISVGYLANEMQPHFMMPEEASV